MRLYPVGPSAQTCSILSTRLRIRTHGAYIHLYVYVDRSRNLFEEFRAGTGTLKARCSRMTKRCTEG